jgi:hypothetical protein
MFFEQHFFKFSRRYFFLPQISQIYADFSSVGFSLLPQIYADFSSVDFFLSPADDFLSPADFADLRRFFFRRFFTSPADYADYRRFLFRQHLKICVNLRNLREKRKI